MKSQVTEPFRHNLTPRRLQSIGFPSKGNKVFFDAICKLTDPVFVILDLLVHLFLIVCSLMPFFL
uniref:Transmembrane protein n=1 Tax=Lepeophtheirus salmonis TaxID=72036 RepID=A0A0K2TQZ5_LEPSM